MAFYGRWAPYVPVAQRRANAVREANKLAKKGQQLRPIRISSRKIATSFWGVAWCDNLEVYADWANRMPRGRTYARNGSIVDLQIGAGEIRALVSGSSLYRIQITIDKLTARKWKAIRAECGAKVSSLLDLMRGRLPESVLKRLSDPKTGMFPHPKEIKIRCSCPDYATLCKHAAATLYGVGHLLDSEPELFFKMRGVEQSELVMDAMSTQQASDSIGLDQQSTLAGEDLGAIFGIDLAMPAEATETSPPKRKPRTAQRGRAAGSARGGGGVQARTATGGRKAAGRVAKPDAASTPSKTVRRTTGAATAPTPKSSAKARVKAKPQQRSPKKSTAKVKAVKKSVVTQAGKRVTKKPKVK